MQKTISELLKQTHIIAVVGLSANPERASNDVAKYMQTKGFRIVPVNPFEEEILGEKSYPNLSSIPFEVDMVNVFRKSQDCLAVVEEAIQIKAKSIWLQLGIINLEAQEIAKNANISFVMNRCLKIEYRQF